MTDRTHREFSRDDIDKIAAVYHSYNGTSKKEYEDIPGFCKAVRLEEIAANDYVLTPGRYVGLTKNEKMSDRKFEAEMSKLSIELQKQFSQSEVIQQRILDALRGVGYGN
jgi:type I restriction enzyme M protein